jgi:hypothetical protein
MNTPRRLVLAVLVLLAEAALASTAGRPRSGIEEGAEDAPWRTALFVRYGKADFEAEGEHTPATRTDTATLLVNVGYEFDERFGVNVFIPFVAGAVTPEGEAQRGVPSLFGNFGVEAGFRFRPSKTWLLEPFALLAVPTAPGDESGTPEEVDRFTLLRGAGFSQGSQEMVFFEAGRLGGEVGLLAAWTPGRFRLRAWLKVGAMFDVRGDLKEDAIVESVGGVVAGYELGLGFHAGLGFTYNRPWTTHEPKRFEAGTLDPVVEWRKGLGAIGLKAVLPIFGNASVSRIFGLSLSGSIRF